MIMDKINLRLQKATQERNINCRAFFLSFSEKKNIEITEAEEEI